MLSLKRAWQTAPSFCGELPSAESEESIDSHVRSMLRSPGGLLVTPEENKPWILARFLFGAGLLQPCNLRLLELPELSDPERALRDAARDRGDGGAGTGAGGRGGGLWRQGRSQDGAMVNN
jgi:hypothetical protein